MKSKTKHNTKIVEHKIATNDNFPFYQVYHNDSYIISHDCRSNIALSEKKMQYNLINKAKKENVVYKIDDGILSGSVLKCDFGIYTEDNALFLIELKNPEREYEHALKQIISSIELLVKANRIAIDQLNARIIVKKYPNILTPNERTLETKIRKHYMCNLKHDSKTMTETL
jgi:hypothetical protein